MLCEIHCHSSHSDGMPSVETMLKKAGKKVGALAITDHNTLRGYEHAKQILISKQSGLVLIPGAEITAKKNDDGLTHGKYCHILALGIEELNKKIIMADVSDVIDYIHSQGGIAIAAHPFRHRQSIDEKDVKLFDALEVINGNTFQEGNVKAFEIAKKHKKPMTSGSDAHLAMDIGKFAFHIEGSTADEILKNIKKGKAVLPDKLPSTLHLTIRKTGGKAFRKLSRYRRHY